MSYRKVNDKVVILIVIVEIKEENVVISKIILIR